MNQANPECHHFYSDNTRLEYLQWGLVSDPDRTVLLLHGFPQPADAWNGIAARLADAGVSAVGLYQRGYEPSDAPVRVRDYSLSVLSSDASRLIEHLGLPNAHVVGHDWGGAVAWMLASRRPDLVRSVTVFSMPHPASLPRALLCTTQLFKSWYISLFSVPGCIEVARVLLGKRFLASWLVVTGLDNASATRYVDRVARNAATLKGALSWYRAFPFNVRPVSNMNLIQSPTTLVWSDRDVAVDGRAARMSSRYVEGRYEFVQLSGVSHWIPEEDPDAATAIILRSLPGGDLWVS